MASKPSVVWYPAYSGNYTTANRPSSNAIERVIVHVTQGSWSGALNWFQSPASGVSAHYTVRSSDGRIGQSVSDLNIAYHAGNWPYNQTSVGIEHEGYVSNPAWFTDAMYRSSARLAAFICDEYGIPINRDRIVGHNEVPGATHTDPGRYWDWATYMGYVRQFSDGGGSSGGYEQIVDNTTSGRFSASGGWDVSTWSSEKYGGNYRYATPANTSDMAEYRFNIPSTGDYRVSAWWPSTSGYNASTPIGIDTTSGLRWVRADQRTSGGRWVSLGTFRMAAGDRYNVHVSRWTSGNSYVIADAMKVESA